MLRYRLPEANQAGGLELADARFMQFTNALCDLEFAMSSSRSFHSFIADGMKDFINRSVLHRGSTILLL